MRDSMLTFQDTHCGRCICRTHPSFNQSASAVLNQDEPMCESSLWNTISQIQQSEANNRLATITTSFNIEAQECTADSAIEKKLIKKHDSTPRYKQKDGQIKVVNRRIRAYETYPSLRQAIDAVLNEGESMRQAARDFKIPFTTLRNSCLRYRKGQAIKVLREAPSINGPKFTNNLLQAPEPNWGNEGPVAEEIVSPGGRQLVINPAQQRCEYCKKKMKKSYKHRNGKCIAPKGRNLSRPRCVYCHMTFGRSTSIPAHLRNSCRAYREVCEMRGVEVPPPSDRAYPSPLPSRGSMMEPTASPVQEEIQPKEIDRKPLVNRTTKLSTKCQNCGQTFANRGNLIRHQRSICKFVAKSDRQTRPPTDQVQQSFVEVPVPLLLDDKSAIDKIHLDVVLSKCVYCQQNVSKKTRFLHHNGRCVVGRINAEHPCPYCPMAFSSRSNLLRHQRERCEPYREEQEHDPIDTIPEDVPEKSVAPEPYPTKAPESCPPKATASCSPKAPTPIATPVEEPVKKPVDVKKKPAKEDTVAPKSITKKSFFKQRRQRIREPDRPKHHERRSVVMKSLASKQSDYTCGYCRKGFASRDSLLEHQRMCTVRKLHKQVKCQFCGVHISNRGNLRKHQKVYCKHAPGKSEIKSEDTDDKETPKKQKTTKLIKKIKQEKVKEDSKAPPDPPRKKAVKEPSSENKEKKPRSSSEPKEKKLKSNPEQKDKKQKLSIEPKEKKLRPSSESKERKLRPSFEQKERKPKLKARHPCEYCKRLFKTRGKVRTHYPKCTVKRSMGKYSCEFCSQGFANSGNLRRHQRSRCKDAKNDGNILNNSIENCLKPRSSKSLSSKQARNDEDTDAEEAMETSNPFNALLEPDLQQSLVEQNQQPQKQEEALRSDGGPDTDESKESPAEQQEQESEPEQEPESEPELEPESEPEQEPKSELEQEPNSEPEQEPNSEPEQGQDSEPEQGQDSEQEQEPDSEPEQEPDSELHPEPPHHPKPESTQEPEVEQETRLLDNNNAESEKEPDAAEVVEQDATSLMEMEEECHREQQPTPEEILPDSEHDRQPVLYTSVTETEHTN